MKSPFWCGEHSCTGWSQEEPREKTAVLEGATGWEPHCSQKASLWERDSQALLSSLCTQGRDTAQPPPASIPTALELWPREGQGSCPTCRWQGHRWIYATSEQKQHSSALAGPQQPACRGCACALEQQALSSELHKVMPTKDVLLLHFFDGVGWHSAALCDEPRRFSMLCFLEHEGGLNVLTC